MCLKELVSFHVLSDIWGKKLGRTRRLHVANMHQQQEVEKNVLFSSGIFYRVSCDEASIYCKIDIMMKWSLVSPHQNCLLFHQNVLVARLCWLHFHTMATILTFVTLNFNQKNDIYLKPLKTRGPLHRGVIYNWLQSLQRPPRAENVKMNGK